MLDLSQDVGCRSRPDEWTGVVVVLSNVLINGLRQLCHAAEGSPTDALASDLGKPALHQVQPGSPGGGEVQVIAGMSCEPGLYLEMGMGAVVVEDHMNVPAPGRGAAVAAGDSGPADARLPAPWHHHAVCCAQRAGGNRHRYLPAAPAARRVPAVLGARRAVHAPAPGHSYDP